MGKAYGIRVASYPDPDRETESWADHLTEYESGGLVRAAVAHQEHLRAAGWRETRLSSDESLWEPPLGKRQRRSVEQAGAMVRRLVQALDRRRPPKHTPGDVVGAAVGCIEALGDLLFYPTTDEAWANAKRPRRMREDPLRPLFRGAGEVLSRASQPIGSRALGAGAQSYAIAESRGRTRAGWSEIHCAPSHTSTGSVKGLHAVELAVDAQRSVAGARIDPIDLAGLTDWLRDGAKPEERVRRYRRRLALQRGEGVCGLISDTAARAATEEISDKAILQRLTQARAKLERRLGRLPEGAEALALATGDTSFLAPVAAPRRENAAASGAGQTRRQVEPIYSHAPRCL